MECLENSPGNPEQGKSWRLLGFHNKQLISVSSSCLFQTDKKSTDLGQRNVPVPVSQSWHIWFPPYYLSFFLSASNVLSHSFFTESSIFSLKLALSAEEKKKKKLKSHGKCSCTTGNCCARFPLGLDLYNSADLNNNFTWGQAKNSVFSHRATAADLLNKSEHTKQLLPKFPVAHGQWITPMQWHSSLIGILHYYCWCHDF